MVFTNIYSHMPAVIARVGIHTNLDTGLYPELTETATALKCYGNTS